MDSNIEHQFEMEMTRRQVMACSDVDHMRQITLSVLDLMEGQRQFLLITCLVTGHTACKLPVSAGVVPGWSRSGVLHQ